MSFAWRRAPPGISLSLLLGFYGNMQQFLKVLANRCKYADMEAAIQPKQFALKVLKALKRSIYVKTNVRSCAADLIEFSTFSVAATLGGHVEGLARYTRLRLASTPQNRQSSLHQKNNTYATEDTEANPNKGACREILVWERQQGSARDGRRLKLGLAPPSEEERIK